MTDTSQLPLENGRSWSAWVLIGRLFQLILLLVVIACGYIAWDAHRFMNTPPSQEAKEVSFTIQPGATLIRVAWDLKKAGLITDVERFRILTWIQGDLGNIRAGEFLLSTSWTPDQVLYQITKGQPRLYRLSVREGLAWWEVAKIVEEQGFATFDDFKAVIHDPEFLAEHSIPFDNAEGFLFPETYLLRKPKQPLDRAQAREVASLMVRMFWKKSAPAWNQLPLKKGVTVSAADRAASPYAPAKAASGETTSTTGATGTTAAPGTAQANATSAPSADQTNATQVGVAQANATQSNAIQTNATQVSAAPCPVVSGEAVTGPESPPALAHPACELESATALRAMVNATVPITGIVGDAAPQTATNATELLRPTAVTPQTTTNATAVNATTPAATNATATVSATNAVTPPPLPAWRDNGPQQPSDVDPVALRRLVILATLVEKETGIPAERGRVAGVYTNRLGLGMLLQCDPTIIYGVGPSFTGAIRRSQLDDEANLYNTYKHAGLPPGPICSPGADALMAAAFPEKHDYIYFVATGAGDGGHIFSKTITEHNRAVQVYRARMRGAAQ